jgi:hypothetical protein
MTDFIIKKLPYDLNSTAGLALVGQYLKRINLNALVDPAFPVRSGIAHSDIVRSYLGLLCQGKSDFEAVEALRASPFALRALGLVQAPSAATLRQRFDAQGSRWFELIDRINERLLGLRIKGQPVDFGLLANGYCPIDIDTFAMDNSDTAKEGVGRTYAGVDGYCPLAAYLGTQGYCLQLALRPGTQHSASETHYNLEHVLPLASRLCAAPLLLRADSGFCSQTLLAHIAQQARALGRRIDVLIKWNPRSTPVEAWAQARRDDPATVWCHHREGKRSCVWQIELADAATHTDDGQTETWQPAVRRIFRLIERTLDKHGNPLLIPQYVLEGWTTSLPAHITAAQVIELYGQHATHEQFHSEFKTDMGLERLPSGKFDTNYLVCQLACVAMNLLRLIGTHTLHGEHAPVRHAAQRRRIRTVMQEMIYKAARLIRHAGRWVLGLGEHDSGAEVFAQHYGQLVST